MIVFEDHHRRTLTKLTEPKKGPIAYKATVAFSISLAPCIKLFLGSHHGFVFIKTKNISNHLKNKGDFMFKIIEPQRQCYYRSHIDLFMGLMQLQQSLYFSPEEKSQATFIIAEEEEGEIYGGAFLHRKRVKDLHLKIRSLLSTFIPDEKWVWECTFFLEPYGLSSAADRPQFMEVFYRDLLEKLREFGSKKNSGFLCLTLNPIECLRIKKKIFWPWILEISPQESLDKLFHGIISFKGEEKKDFGKANWGKLLESSFQIQEAI